MFCAGVAELADAYGSGPYGGNPMKVQVLSPAPFTNERPSGRFFVASRSRWQSGTTGIAGESGEHSDGRGHGHDRGNSHNPTSTTVTMADESRKANKGRIHLVKTPRFGRLANLRGQNHPLRATDKRSKGREYAHDLLNMRLTWENAYCWKSRRTSLPMQSPPTDHFDQESLRNVWQAIWRDTRPRGVPQRSTFLSYLARLRDLDQLLLAANAHLLVYMPDMRVYRAL